MKSKELIYYGGNGWDTWMGLNPIVIVWDNPCEERKGFMDLGEAKDFFDTLEVPAAAWDDMELLHATMWKDDAEPH